MGRDNYLDGRMGFEGVGGLVMSHRRVEHTLPDLDELTGADLVLSRRPTRRADCPPVYVPCPYLSCHYHLWADVTADGRFVESPVFGDIRATCALREAEKGGMPVEQLAATLNVSARWVWEVIFAGMAKSREILSRPLVGTSESQKQGRVPRVAVIHQTRIVPNCRPAVYPEDEYDD